MPDVIKLFYHFNFRMFMVSYIVCPLQASPIFSLMFAPKVRAYSSETPLRFLTLTKNIKLGWKGLPGTNTLACYEHQ